MLIRSYKDSPAWGGVNFFAIARGMLKRRCLDAIQFADIAAELLDVHHNHSELLEGIAKNLQRHSDCYDVNRKLLASAETRLARHASSDEDRESAVKRILKAEHAVVDVESGQIFGAQAGLVGHDTVKKVAEVKAPEKIDALEQELLGLLERQLDGMDAADRKPAMYTILGDLALKRNRYEDAAGHISTAPEIFKPFRQSKSNAWKFLVDERDKILLMPYKNALARLRDAGGITSFNVNQLLRKTLTARYSQTDAREATR